MPWVPVSNYPTRGMGTRHPNVVNRTGFPLDLENLENHGKPEKHGKSNQTRKTWKILANLEKTKGLNKNLERSFKTWEKIDFEV